MNVYWTLITAMMMLHVPTHMDHYTVLVMLDLLEMVLIAQVQYAGLVTKYEGWLVQNKQVIFFAFNVYGFLTF